MTFDPVRARELLAAAGYAGGAKFPVIRLLVNRNERQRLLAQAVAAMWREVLGVETEVTLKDWEDYESSLAAGDFDIARRSIVMQTPDEERNLLAMFGAARPSQLEPDGLARRRKQLPGPRPPSRRAAEEEAARERSGIRRRPRRCGADRIPVYSPLSRRQHTRGFATNLSDAPSLKHVRIETGWKPREGPLASPPAATVSGL